MLNPGWRWSAGVSDLDLIDDGDIIALEHVDHLDGARRVQGTLHFVALLPCAPRKPSFNDAIGGQGS